MTGPVPVVVVFRGPDGTTGTHRFTSAVWPSAQILDDPDRKRALVQIRDRQGRPVGTAHYSDVSFVLVGECVAQQMPMDQPSATDGGQPEGDPA